MRKLEQDGSLYLAVSEAQATFIINRLRGADDIHARLDAVRAIEHINCAIASMRKGRNQVAPEFAADMSLANTVFLGFHGQHLVPLVATALREMEAVH